MGQETNQLYRNLWNEFNALSEEDQKGERGKAIQQKIAQRQRCSTRYQNGIVKTPIRG